ncbi:MAG: sugar-binding domain-containing protein [Rothia sp. (in: high G+C Gram-positive bacteria)]|nr:sugar-binding domain-containing protein [Rothia sp. (in: high G+C Gram-positive bacteria)]
MAQNKTGLDIYDPEHLYAAARLYYEEGQSQSEIAHQLQVSRPTVSRMLSQAREAGIVQIKVVHPNANSMAGLSTSLAQALNLEQCYVAPGIQTPNALGQLGTGMASVTRQALTDMNLEVGDGLVVASGLAMYNISRMELPSLRGVVISPAVGGLAEPEPWHQTSEIARALAHNTGSTYIPLFAGVMPSTLLFNALQEDTAYQQIKHLWATAKGAFVGVGSRTSGRTSLASAIPKQALTDAEGDVCLHFFNSAGEELTFPGAERTIRIPLDDLRRIPHVAAVAVGDEKVDPIITASRIGILNSLVTDERTANQILNRLA